MVKGKGFEARFKELVRIIKPLSKISLENKIKKLEHFKKKESKIKSELENIQVAVIHLKHMPDVAKYYVSKNEFAINLLSYLKDNDGIAYSKLRSSLPNDSSYDTILNFGLDLLIRAQLIEKQPDCSNVQNYILKLTNNFKNLIKTKNDR